MTEQTWAEQGGCQWIYQSGQGEAQEAWSFPVLSTPIGCPVSNNQSPKQETLCALNIHIYAWDNNYWKRDLEFVVIILLSVENKNFNKEIFTS